MEETEGELKEFVRKVVNVELSFEYDMKMAHDKKSHSWKELKILFKNLENSMSNSDFNEFAGCELRKCYLSQFSMIPSNEYDVWFRIIWPGKGNTLDAYEDASNLLRPAIWPENAW
jgi:hypothetical protein